MAKAYDEQRPTTKMPGTDGAVAGTAVNDWIDDRTRQIETSARKATSSSARPRIQQETDMTLGPRRSLS